MNNRILFSSFKAKEVNAAFMELGQLNDAEDLTSTYYEENDECPVPEHERIPEVFRSKKALALWLISRLEGMGLANRLQLPVSEDWHAIFSEISKAYTSMLPERTNEISYFIEVFVDGEYNPEIQQQVVYRIDKEMSIPYYALQWVEKEDEQWGELMEYIYTFLGTCMPETFDYRFDDLQIDLEDYITYNGGDTKDTTETKVWEAAMKKGEKKLKEEHEHTEKFLYNLAAVHDHTNFFKLLKELKPANMWQRDLHSIATFFSEFIEMNMFDYMQTHFNAIQEDMDRENGADFWYPNELLFFGLGVNDPVSLAKASMASTVSDGAMFFFSHRQRLEKGFREPYPFPVKLWEGVKMLQEFYTEFAKSEEDGLNLPTNKSIAETPALAV